MDESVLHCSQPPCPRFAPAGRSWLMFDRSIHCTDRDVEDHQDCDGTVSQISYTCTGRPIRVSVRAADPPAVSRLHLHWPGRPEFSCMKEPLVVAAHAHSILFKMTVPLEGRSCCYRFTFPYDLFVYSAYSSPPSLHRLPPCFIGGFSDPDEDIYFKPYRRQQQRIMWEKEMGVLCHGDKGEFTVVDFTNFGPDPELFLLHHHAPSASASCKKDTEIEWKIKKVRFPTGPVVHKWITDAILPFGGQCLCWVDCYQGILVVDVLLANDKNSPDEQQLRYIPLPEEALTSRRIYRDGDCSDPARCVCVTCNGVIKLVCIEGLPLHSHSRIISWSLDDISRGRWQICDTMEAAEFWGLCDGHSLPRVKPRLPLVSLSHPDEICFMLEKEHGTCWMIKVDMRNKVLKSSAIYTGEEEEWNTHGDKVPSSMGLRNGVEEHGTLPARGFCAAGTEMTHSQVRDNVSESGIAAINTISCICRRYRYTTGRVHKNSYYGDSFIPSEVSSYLVRMPLLNRN